MTRALQLTFCFAFAGLLASSCQSTQPAGAGPKSDEPKAVEKTEGKKPAAQAKAEPQAVNERAAAEQQVRDLRKQLSDWERGRYESAPIRAAKTSLADLQKNDREAMEAKPGVADLRKQIEDLQKKQKEADAAVNEIRGKIEADAELAALKKAAAAAAAAHRAKQDEKFKASKDLETAAAASAKIRDEINKLNAKVIEAQLADNAELARCRKDIADLEAKIAALAQAEEARKAAQKKKPEEKKPAEKKADAPKQTAPAGKNQ
jgi:chromosome segregation ATPase